MIDFCDLAGEVRQRTRDDLDRLALFEVRACAGLLFGGRAQQVVDLLTAERCGLVAGTDEPGHARCVLDERPRIVGHVHLHQHVPGKHPLLGRHLLAVLRLDDLLGRDDDLTDDVVLPRGGDPVLQVGPDLGLMAGIGVDDVPVEQRLPLAW